MDHARSARSVSVTAWLTRSPRLGHAPNGTNRYPRADIGGISSVPHARCDATAGLSCNPGQLRLPRSDPG
jgi:hypothetical protein